MKAAERVFRCFDDGYSVEEAVELLWRGSTVPPWAPSWVRLLRDRWEASGEQPGLFDEP